MENQVNVNDQNSQQIGQNPTNQPITFPEKHGINCWIILTIVLLVIVISASYYISSLKNQLNIARSSIPPAGLPTSSVSKDNQIPTYIPTDTQKTTSKWREASIPSLPGFSWIFQYPNEWHIVTYQSKEEASYPVIIEMNPTPIMLDLVSIKTRCVILAKGYDQLTNPEEEIKKMLAESKNNMKDIKEESFSVGQNIVYRLQGESKSDAPKTPLLVYYILLSEKMNDGKMEKSVMKAELNFNWAKNSNLDKEYSDILDFLVRSLRYEKARGGAGY